MTNISYKATNRSNTLCIARFGNAVNDVCHRNLTVREVLRDALKLLQMLILTHYPLSAYYGINKPREVFLWTKLLLQQQLFLLS